MEKMAEERSIPRDIGGYSIIEILGEGGMSVVYTAMQEHPKRKVAIKVLRGGLFSPTAAKRFHQEVEILGQLDHPWIAKIYDAGTHDDGNGATPYYVMEHVENARELSDYLKNETLIRREKLKLFTMITSAVEHGHHKGIVHRDLKPGNILIDQSGEPKIIDFGVARSVNNNKVNEEAMTEAGRLVGTVQFMAPEQVDAQITDIDARCDVYALGAVLYQMLTNRLPRTLEGLPIYEAVRQICKEDPIRPTTYDSTIDQNLEAIIMMALETNRAKRYQTAGSFGRDMLRYLGDRTIKARKATTIDRMRLFCRRHRTQLLVGSAVLFVLALAVSGFLYLQSESDTEMDKLQEQVDALNKENETLVNNAQPSESLEVVESAPILHLPSPPNEVEISEDGKTIAAIIGEDYFATHLNGAPISLPPIQIEPSEATIGLSPQGKTLAIVSNQRCRIVPLGIKKPPIRHNGNFRGLTSMFVGERMLGVALDDMSLHLIGDKNQARRTTSITGVYKSIAIPMSGEQLIAATDRWIFVWRLKEFPKNARQFDGVQDPVLVGGFHRKIVVVGQNGQIVIHELNKTTPTMTSLRLEAKMDEIAMNPKATILGYISNEKAFLFNIETSETTEQTWMPEVPVGIGIDDNNKCILWTQEGKVYREP